MAEPSVPPSPSQACASATTPTAAAEPPVDTADVSMTLKWSIGDFTGVAPSPRCWQATCTVGRELFMMGGFDGRKKYLSDLYTLDTSTMLWKEQTVSGQTPQSRYAHSITNVSGEFFVVGGGNGKNFFNCVHVLKKSEGKWVWTKPAVKGTLPSPRAAHGAALVKKKIFFFGGDGGSGNYSEDVHSLNVNTMVWTKERPRGIPPCARGWHSTNAIGNKVYVIGGCDGVEMFNDVHVLDTETMKWEQPVITGIAPCARYSHSTATCGTKLIVFGGSDGRRVFNDVHIFDTLTNTWVRPLVNGTIPAERHAHAGVCIGNTMFVFGGYDKTNIFNDLYTLYIGSTSSIPLKPNSLHDDMRKLVNNETLSDITFILDGDERFYAHKNILVFRCDHFKAMFLGNMLESRLSEVSIPGIRKEVFHCLMEFLYTGTTKIPNELAQDVLAVADQYTLEELKSMAQRTMERNLDLSNVATMFQIADMYQAAELKGVCLKFIAANIRLVVETPAFEQLSREMMLEIFRCQES